jgi:hypothetical protein
MNKIFALLAAFAFVLPFMSVTCNGQKILEATGVRLISVVADPSSARTLLPQQNEVGGLQQEMFKGANRSDAGPFRLIPLGLIATLAAGVAAFFPTKTGNLICGIGSLANITLLMIFRSNIAEIMVPAQFLKGNGLGLDLNIGLSYGFYFSILMSIGTAIVSFRVVSQEQGLAVSGVTSSRVRGVNMCPHCATVNRPDESLCKSCSRPLSAPGSHQASAMS